MLSNGTFGRSPSSTLLNGESMSPGKNSSLPIRLAVRGEDIVLTGRFNHWLPLSAEQSDGEGSIQMLVDATGLAPGAGAAADLEEDLFSFSATTVERVSRFAVMARGSLRHDGVEVPAEALIQTPPAHTAFFAITFSFGRDPVPGLWVLLEGLVGDAVAGAQLSPHGWLRDPTLAAA